MTKYVFLILTIFWVMSCDISSTDYYEYSSKQENQTNTFYTIPDLGLTIDPTAFDNLKGAKSLSIKQLPKFGELKFIENGFVFYQANDKNANADEFIIEGKTSDGIAVSEEIKISFVKNIADLPCFAGAIGDKITVESEKSIEINVLANDKTCESLQDKSLSIEIQPKNGKVETINNKISYLPNADFIGTDTFFYRITINNKKNPVAPVEVLVTEPIECTKGMFDDVVEVLNYAAGSDLMIDVLQNDKICKQYEKAELKILKDPEKGTIKVDKNIISRPVFMYKAINPFKGEDNFEYALYRSDKKFIKAVVKIKFL